MTGLLRGLIAILMSLIAGTADACEIPLQGQAAQGGLVIGRVAAGTPVSVNGAPVRVSPDGLFLVGFGRDAPGSATVVAGGMRCVLAVEDRNYKITRIEGLPRRKVTPRAEDLKRIKADNAAIGRVRRLDTAATDFAAGFAWPLKGRVSGVFGSQRVLNGNPRRPHNGVDIAAPTGTPIRAPAPGTVALVHPDMFFSGKTVMLDHGHGLSSVYIHMSAITVKAGQRVRAGDVIGKIGMTGRATGPHLHWGISLFRTHLDPALIAGPMNNN